VKAEKQKFDNIQAHLQSANDDALVVRHKTPGLLFISGATALDLINRMSTNDLETAPEGTIRTTVLTDAHARIVDRIQVISTNDGLVTITSPGLATHVHHWLKGYVFFQDDVTFANLEDDWSYWGMYGPGALTKLQSLFPNFSTLSPGEVIASPGAYVWGTEEPVQGGQFLLDHSMTNEAQKIWDANDETESAFQILRVEAGIPQFPSEISNDYIPLEVGLWDVVSFTKGCYIGQEIIARMESRRKLAKRLHRIQLEQYAPAGASLRQDGRQIGKITSVIHSPNRGWIGLAVAKPGSVQENLGQVLVGDDEIKGHLEDLNSPRHGPAIGLSS
jgi:aminomethyltransferase